MDTTDPEVVHLLEEIADGGGGGSSGTEWTRVTAAADYTASDGESVWADATNEEVRVTLPQPQDNSRVRILAVDVTNDVIVEDNSVEKINDQGGENSEIEMMRGEAIEVESNGSTWWII